MACTVADPKNPQPPKPDPDLPTSDPDLVSAWLQAIESASLEEQKWRENADEAVLAYRGEDNSSADFNIYHANIETLVPALYNSRPVPDIRRRYNDEDVVGKAVADLLERAILYSLDSYDFDAVMTAGVWDMAVAGRGLMRVRHTAHYLSDNQTVAFEEVTSEYVPWRSFRRGPGRLWIDVTWCAFELYLTRADIEAHCPPEVVDQVPFTYSAGAKDEKDTSTGAPRFGKRARVWEVWDKDVRKVLFICPEFGKHPLWTVDDPLELEGFFPVPRPMMAVSSTDTLVPISSYSIYKNLIAELNELTRRIKKLVRQLRPRGGYAGVTLDIKTINDADDGELVPISGAEMFIAGAGGGIEKAITWFPLEPTVAALAQLVAQREIIKQTIYEVTKIADVMRGATNPNETLGAQQLKAQWGSLSVQRMQQEVARFARDVFRLKSEVLTKLPMQTLMIMTGLKYPTMQEKAAAQMRINMAEMQKQKPPGPPGMPPPGAPGQQPPGGATVNVNAPPPMPGMNGGAMPPPMMMPPGAPPIRPN